MGDISSAVAEAIRNRATSTSLVTYSFFWLAWHWQGVYAALFTSEDKIYEKIGLLKNEYLRTYFFGWHGWDTLVGFIVPLLLTILFIWPLQELVLIHAYKKEQNARSERKKVRLQAEKKLEEYRAELLINESKKIDAQAKKVDAATKLTKTKQKAASTDPAIIWNDDYEIFKKSKYFTGFKLLREAVYEHNGSIYVSAYNNRGREFRVPSTLLAYADSEGLIKINQTSETVTLTSKGKHFIKRYQQDDSTS